MGLSSLGVRKGDRVCIYLDSSPEYLISYFAIWRIGGIAVPTNIVYREEELLHAIVDAGACAIITDPRGAGIIENIREHHPLACHVISTGSGGQGMVEWASFPEAPAQMRATNCSLDDLCQLQYTAGTTGRPKGAMLTHGNWITALDTECEALRITPDDVYLGIYPMGHVGLSWGLAVLRAGGTYVMMERFDLEQYLALASHYKVTILAGMPPVIHSLVHSPPGTEQQTCRCPGDHFGWRTAPAGNMGDVRSAVSHPCSELVWAFRNDSDRVRYHHLTRVPAPYPRLPERGSRRGVH